MSLPSKFKYTPDVNMSNICLRCGYPVSHLFSVWVLTGVGKRVRQFCSIVLNLCLVLWGNALSVHRMIAFAAGANVLVLAVFCCTADTLEVVAETVAGRWTALLPSCVSLDGLEMPDEMVGCCVSLCVWISVLQSVANGHGPLPRNNGCIPGRLGIGDHSVANLPLTA